MTKTTSIKIPIDSIQLQGDLQLPEHAKGLIVFAHGSGSSRLSPRNRYVANILAQRSFATLLIDLLTDSEEKVDDLTGELRFDIPFLANRLVEIVKYLEKSNHVKNLPIGYFGASTGGGAAIIAAAKRPQNIKAIVSRGGRPDLANTFLSKVKAPVLLIVGGDDPEVLKLNQVALSALNQQSKLEIVEGATHLFEEEGKLDIVSNLASSWFEMHLI